MEVEFGLVGGSGGSVSVQPYFRVKPNSVEIT